MRRLILIAVLVSAASGCSEKPTDDNLDKWMRTERGPGKLQHTVADESLDADVSAHAAVNLVRMGRDPDVKAVLEQMSKGRKAEVVSKLITRLWAIARVDGDMKLPGPPQVSAKDALVMIRKYGGDAERKQIDDYMIDWYAVPSYEGRANAGQFTGSTVIRMIGAPSGKKLIGVLDGVIAAPGQEKVKNKVGDELLIALAATQDPTAVKDELALVRMNRGDDSLPGRVLAALARVYVDPQGLFDVAEAAPLVPNLDFLVSIAKDDSMSGAIANDAISLIRAVGPPQCLQPLVDMIPQPHGSSRYRYVVATNAIQCGGAKSIAQVIRALPEGSYDQASLGGSVINAIVAATPRDVTLAQVRELLGDKGRVQRWIAVEALAKLKSVEDAPKLLALAHAPEKLDGFWGDQSGVDAKDRKADPTLGDRAKELAGQLGAGK